MEEIKKFFNIILTEYVNEKNLLELDLAKVINDNTITNKEKLIKVKSIIRDISNINDDIETFSSYLPVNNMNNVENH